jgi:hypothetical protein
MSQQTHRHLVQFFGADDTILLANVVRFAIEGLEQGGGVIVIAEALRRERVVRAIGHRGIDATAAIRDRRLLLLDPGQTLSTFVVNGQPQWSLFDKQMMSLMRSLRARRQPNHTGIRIYGEMSGALWAAGEITASIRLQEFWSRLLDLLPFDLFHSYPVSEEALSDPNFHKLLRAETEVLRTHDQIEAAAAAAG